MINVKYFMEYNDGSIKTIEDVATEENCPNSYAYLSAIKKSLDIKGDMNISTLLPDVGLVVSETYDKSLDEILVSWYKVITAKVEDKKSYIFDIYQVFKSAGVVVDDLRPLFVLMNAIIHKYEKDSEKFSFEAKASEALTLYEDLKNHAKSVWATCYYDSYRYENTLSEEITDDELILDDVIVRSRIEKAAMEFVENEPIDASLNPYLTKHMTDYLMRLSDQLDEEFKEKEVKNGKELHGTTS